MAADGARKTAKLKTLTLEMTWTLGDRQIRGHSVEFWPSKPGRYFCGFCGSTMGTTKLIEHYPSCAANFGEL